MKKTKIFYLVLFVVISSFFLVKGVNAYYSKVSDPAINTFTITDVAHYKVVHKQMDLDGQGYTTVLEENKETTIGTSVTPGVQTYTGFISPTARTVTINQYEGIVIEYLYDRETYHLSIGNSEYVTTYVNGVQVPTIANADYYYGTEIHLIADNNGPNGLEFNKWSNEEVYPDTVFTMDQDITIRPIYGTPYIVEYQVNGGTPAPAPPV